ncbi:MAG TPA: hypothetical protein VG939_08570 [Caulobacteraceae bacterium]|nr:hypothetical protein [Caulobacteraceae bacterium]
MRPTLAAFLASLVLASDASAAPATFGANLLKNPSAETPSEGAAVPGWSGPPTVFDADDYGHQSGEWDWGLSGCAACGKRYFRLQFEGEQDQQPAAEQTVDLSGAAADIDAGKVRARISGELGGYRDSDTTAWVEAVFEDGAGRVLATLKTVPFDPAALPAPERGSTSLTPLQAQGPVPAGTRKARFRFVAKATGASGSYLGLSDDLALVLTK